MNGPWRRLAAAVVVLALAGTTVAACSDDDEAAPEPTEAAPTTTEAEPEPEPDTTPEPSEPGFVFGWLGPERACSTRSPWPRNGRWPSPSTTSTRPGGCSTRRPPR